MDYHQKAPLTSPINDFMEDVIIIRHTYRICIDTTHRIEWLLSATSKHLWENSIITSLHTSLHFVWKSEVCYSSKSDVELGFRRKNERGLGKVPFQRRMIEWQLEGQLSLALYIYMCIEWRNTFLCISLVGRKTGSECRVSHCMASQEQLRVRTFAQKPNSAGIWTSNYPISGLILKPPLPY